LIHENEYINEKERKKSDVEHRVTDVGMDLPDRQYEMNKYKFNPTPSPQEPLAAAKTRVFSSSRSKLPLPEFVVLSSTINSFR
jgi:hypothetical protein